MKMPSRHAFGLGELCALAQCALHHYVRRIDPLYQSTYESLFCNDFSAYMGGGYTDAVNSGTCAAFISLKALGLNEGDIVAISGICDPGVYNSIILGGLKPLPLLPKRDDITFSLSDFSRLMSRINISTLIYIHAFGSNTGAADLITIRSLYPELKIIEDISQSVGGTFLDVPLGNFSNVAISSTMGRKSLISGASGGLLFTKDLDIYHQILSYSDRGKLVSPNGCVIKDAPSNVNISLNFSADEFGCAIARSSLNRIRQTQINRLRALNYIADTLDELQPNAFCSVIRFPEGSCPFVGILQIRSPIVLERRDAFVSLLQAKNIPINPNFNQIAFLWPWLQRYVANASEEFDSGKQLSLDWSRKHIIIYIHEKFRKDYCSFLALGISQSIDTILHC